MKIVFVHSFNDRSGSPKVLSQVVRTTARHGIKSEVLTSAHSDGFLSDLPGIRHTVFYRRSENKFFTLLYYLASQAWLFLFSLRYIRQDVIFYVNTMMPFGAALAARLMGKPVIFHIHETSIRPNLLKQFLRLVIRFSATKIIFVSDYLRNTESFGNKRQYVVHNAIDLERVQMPVKTVDTPFSVLMICSLKTYKGLLEFLSIAERLISKRTVHFTLVLNADPEEIDVWFKNISISPNVTLIPRQADVAPFYTQADLLLNLSRPDEWVETFGLTILEGMAYGLPVIVPPVGGPSEIVTDGQEGFLISCYETSRIVEVIERLADDPEFHSRLARNACRRAKDFCQASFEEQIAGIIHS